jgi:endonuclease-3
VILSAQCTDARVNVVTPKLFARFKSAEDFANCKVGELEKLILSTGFYKNKAKNIKACCQKIMSDYEGKVPNTMETLITLPGVGRKTANVILSEYFNKPEGIVVDTHAGRLAVRIGLVDTKNTKAAEQIEADLMQITPKTDWRNISLYLVFQGRLVCTAKKAYCDKCEICKVCDSCRKIKEYAK